MLRGLRRTLVAAGSARGRARLTRDVCKSLGLRGAARCDTALVAACGAAGRGPVRRELDALKLTPDGAQAAVAAALDMLAQEQLYTVWPLRKACGVYLHGSVGIGKTVLLDCFARAAGAPLRRTHFHDFMLDVHQRLRHATLPEVGQALAAEHRFLCFDEFQVNDVADAVVLHELFQTLFSLGTVVVATSNRSPSRLYENGLNRQALFEPFQNLLQFECLVVDVDALHAEGQVPEYRRAAAARREWQGSTFFPAGDEGLVRGAVLRFGGVPAGSPRTVKVAMGRELRVPELAGRLARFTFSDLCESNVGAVDYISLVEHCDVVLLEDLPRLRDKYDGVTRRFITLVDVLYDRRKKLVISAQASLDEVFDGVMTTSAPHDGSGGTAASEILVAEEGGSSGRLTTMLGTDFEWSATGRIGASLARGDDVGFAIARAKSRILEMQTTSYWRS